MRTSPTDKLLRLAAKRQIVRTKDASELGIPRNYLGRLVRKGVLEKVRRGLYTSPDFSGTEHITLIEAAYQLPKRIVCLLSALRFHNFTTQSPYEIWMAIGQKAWAPKISSPPIRLIRMSGVSLHFGVKEYKVSGTVLRVFIPRLQPSENCCRLLQVPEQDWSRRRYRSTEGMSSLREGNDGRALGCCKHLPRGQRHAPVSGVTLVDESTAKKHPGFRPRETALYRPAVQRRFWPDPGQIWPRTDSLPT